MLLRHGSRAAFVAHIGLCLTDDVRAAADYAGFGGVVTDVELPLAGLRVVTVRSFREGSSDACGDTKAEIAKLQKRRIDVVCFEDEAPGGRAHKTWRIISEKALKALEVQSWSKLH